MGEQGVCQNLHVLQNRSNYGTHDCAGESDFLKGIKAGGRETGRVEGEVDGRRWEAAGRRKDEGVILSSEGEIGRAHV